MLAVQLVKPVPGFLRAPTQYSKPLIHGQVASLGKE